MNARIEGLIAAPHTPLDAEGQLNLTQVERQAAHLADSGIVGVFIGGSTGEGVSLTYDERRQLAERWMAVTRGSRLRVIVHVGGTCLPEIQQLAAQANQLQADGVAALAPFYYKPETLEALLDYCQQIAGEAPDLPFFFYHIPVMTGVRLPMQDFLRRGLERIPNLAGLKYTDDDLMQLQECLSVAPDRLDILHGFDEILLAGLVLGVRAATGSTYNFAAPLYHELLRAFAAGDLVTAATRQRSSVRLVRLLSRFGFAAASKAMMSFVGIDCGPVRPPLRSLGEEQLRQLRHELENEQLMDYIRRP